MIRKFIYLCSIILIIKIIKGDDACPSIISRLQWQAREVKSLNYIINPLAYVVVHHTATPKCETIDSCSNRVRSIQDYHMDELFWGDVGFSFFIGGDGNVYEGVGWNKEGAHTYGWNKKSIGIAFIGSYQTQKASEKMLQAAVKLISCGKHEGMLRPNVKVIGANQVTSTVSPGAKLFEQIKNWPEWTSNP
ncbi:peptidoglycan-recognition protein 2-like [Microplitis mediator]|uniref:peptidoglycan-recognition protein 2-like n=1 Tax=Microplitis mediator TaxID=375433 RepID=UPI0025525256|nr:peptidoglycan-recognition protein 2-like [Microplitis mediator]